MPKFNESFDLTDEFKAVVEPMVKALHAKCGELNIPLVVGVCTSANDSNDRYQAAVTVSTSFNTNVPPVNMKAAQALLSSNSVQLCKFVLNALQIEEKFKAVMGE